MRWFVALAVVLIMVSACESDSTYLPALLADPISSYSHPDLELVLRAETPETVNALGQPSSARVTTVFAVVPGADVDAIERNLQAQAEQSGWVFESEEPAESPDEPKRLIAAKALPEGVAELRIALVESDSQGGSEFSIRLDFRHIDGP